MTNIKRQAIALYECEVAMARHCYHHARGTHRDELEEIWFSDPSRHHWKAMKSVEEAYVKGQEKAAKLGYHRRLRTHPEAALGCHDYRYLEEISVHVLSIAMLKASEDGTAVRAFWFTPGYVSPTLPNDVYRFIQTPCWMWERYTVDFDLDEDDQYKICNFGNLADGSFQIDCGGWTDKASREKALMRKLHPDDRGGPPPMDNATGFMEMPKLPVMPFQSFGDLD